MKSFVCLLLFSSCHFLSADSYQFQGKHFLASYLNCDFGAISNLDRLIEAMDEAVVASGANILNKTAHVFPPNGLTLTYLLAESHASLHTYPEHGACFVDLFTCGTQCSSEKFHKALKAYLNPQEISARLLLRDSNVQEIPFEP